MCGMTRAAVLIAGLLALTACSSTSDADDTAATTPSPTPSTPPAGGAMRGTPAEIVEVLKQHSLDCYGLRPPAEPRTDGTVAEGCDIEGGERVWVTIYPGADALQAEVAAVAQATWRRFSILAGENWTLTGPDAFVEKAHAALGGAVTRSAGG